jgi:hypothetical protein
LANSALRNLYSAVAMEELSCASIPVYFTLNPTST